MIAVTASSVLHYERPSLEIGVMNTLLARLHIDPYIASILGVVALASVIPATGVGVVVTSDAGTAMIAAMFFLQGARLSPQAALAGARHWRLHVVVLASTF